MKFRAVFASKPPPKVFQMIDFIAAIVSIKFSSKSELSSRFFGRFKNSVLFEYLGVPQYGTWPSAHPYWEGPGGLGSSGSILEGLGELGPLVRARKTCSDRTARPRDVFSN